MLANTEMVLVEGVGWGGGGGGGGGRRVWGGGGGDVCSGWSRQSSCLFVRHFCLTQSRN